MTTATQARTADYGKGEPDPTTATCEQHVVASPDNRETKAVGKPVPLPPGTDLTCVVCPLPHADLIGTVVLGWGMSSRFLYGGEHDSPGMSCVEIGVGRGGLSVLRSEPSRVMPADTPVPAKDSRVVVVKRQKHEVPSFLRCTKAGLYEVNLTGHPDVKPDWFSKKGEAVKAGLRRIAILDYQATRQTGVPA